MSSPATTSASPPLEVPVVLDPSKPSFLNHLSSIYAHSGSPPFTATFTHSIPGPAHGVRSDCYWYPPRIPLSMLDVVNEDGESEEGDWDNVHRADETGGGLHFSAAFDSASSGRSSCHATGGVRGREQGTARPRLQLVIDPEQSPRQASTNVEPPPEIAILIFIPGNPGSIQFYLPFLDAIRAKNPSLGILAKSHLGHSPRLNKKEVPGGAGGISVSSAALNVQVDSVIEVVDRVREEYEGIFQLRERGGKLKVVLVGHSVGAWIITRILGARPDAVDGSFLLFPALCELSLTPNGKRLDRLFAPILAYIVAAIAFLLFSIILPSKITLFLINKSFPHWPRHQQFVLRSLIRSPRAVFSSLKMARDEMHSIRALSGVSVSHGESFKNEEGLVEEAGDETQTTRNVLKNHAKKIWVFYAFEGDGWVREQGRFETFRALREGGGAANYEGVKVLFGEGTGEVVFGDDIPHDFCINHGHVMADQCTIWLERGGFVNYN